MPTKHSLLVRRVIYEKSYPVRHRAEIIQLGITPSVDIEEFKQTCRLHVQNMGWVGMPHRQLRGIAALIDQVDWDPENPKLNILDGIDISDRRRSFMTAIMWIYRNRQLQKIPDLVEITFENLFSVGINLSTGPVDMAESLVVVKNLTEHATDLECILPFMNQWAIRAWQRPKKNGARIGVMFMWFQHEKSMQECIERMNRVQLGNLKINVEPSNFRHKSVIRDWRLPDDPDSVRSRKRAYVTGPHIHDNPGIADRSEMRCRNCQEFYHCAWGCDKPAVTRTGMQNDRIDELDKHSPDWNKRVP